MAFVRVKSVIEELNCSDNRSGCKFKACQAWCVKHNYFDLQVSELACIDDFYGLNVVNTGIIKVIVVGPKDSPYADCRIPLTLKIPPGYPFDPPQI